jgi:hypothetical protein
MANVYIHFGIAPYDLNSTLLNRLAAPIDLTGETVTLNIRSTVPGSTAFTRAATNLAPLQNGVVQYTFLAADFGTNPATSLALNNSYDLWWSVTPAVANAPANGQFPEGVYDTLWVVP